MQQVAVSFRDRALFRVFQISLTALRQLQQQQIPVADRMLSFFACGICATAVI